MYKRKKNPTIKILSTSSKKVIQLVQRKMRQAYLNYIEEVISIEHVPEQKQQEKHEQIRTYIKHRKEDNSTIPGLKCKGFTDPKQKADILNRQFQSVLPDHMRSVNRNSEQNK